MFVLGQQLFGIELINSLNGGLVLLLRSFFHNVANERAHEPEVDGEHVGIGAETSCDDDKKKIGSS